MTAFCWPPIAAGGGSSGNTSSGLETSGAPVDVSGAAPPVAGQVLTAIDPTHAQWRVPGLKYDPAIRFNVNAGGVATIEPGTWGFVYTYPVTAADITIFVVSSLAAPPVDSRFGLYVSPSVGVPVTVSLIGASQIMDLNGTLGTTAALRPGAMYEWVFYHEGGEAIWGLVSQTGVLPSIADTVTNALVVDFVLTEPQTLDGNSGIYDGVTVANDYVVLATAQSPASNNGYWLTHDGPWERAPDYPEPPDILVGQGAYVQQGDTQRGSLWMHFGNNVWRAISVGNANHASRHGRGGHDIVAAARLSESSGPTTLDIGAVSDGQFLQRSGTSIIGTAIASEVAIKTAVRTVALTTITLSGLQTITGVSLVSGDRILCAAQSPSIGNGIYVVSSGAWTRATDYDASSKIKSGCLIACSEGTAIADTVWMLTTNDPITLGSSGLAYSNIGGLGATLAPSTITTLAAGAAGTSYKWAHEDHVHQVDSIYPAANNFRLTTQTGVSTPADGTFSIVYLVTHNGNRIALYDGTKWVDHVPANSNIVLSGMTSGIPVDIFAFSGGSRTLVSLEKQAWSNASTRVVPLQLQDGVWCKAGTLTRRYLGTILPDSATTYTIATNPAANTKAVCGLWNQDNRLQTSFQWSAPAGTVSPSTPSVWAPLTGWGTPQIEMVLGQIYDSHVARAVAGVSITTSAQQAAIGLGIDSTSSVQGIRGMATGTGAAVTSTLSSHRSVKPANPGLHTVNLLAQVSATGPAFSGNQDLVQSGVIVDLWH